MEFQNAAAGSTSKLRDWLQKYPMRVNIPSVGTRYTLLHTAASAGHLSTVQMLMEEFHADPSIPCGGVGNTAVHIAAAAGNVAMLSYLLGSHPELKPNAFMEYPINLVTRLPRSHAGRDECIAMLRAHEEQLKQQLVTSATPKQPQERQANKERKQTPRVETKKSPERQLLRGSPTPALLPVASQRDRFQLLRLSSEDNCETHSPDHQQRLSLSPTSPAQALRSSLVNANDRILLGSIVPGTTREPSTNNLRNERNITNQSVLPLDLHTFRLAYAGNFEFTECNHFYRVRGLIPYTFRDSIYYTPMIFIVAKARGKKHLCAKKEHTNGNDGERWGTNDGGAPTFIYRALIDRKELKDLFINRRALYIDMGSGAIIPSKVDSKYGNLLEFVRHAVVANFERIPPLTNSRNSAKSVQENAPLFQPCQSEREIRLRIFRDLSMFSDDIFTYDSAARRVTGFLPLFLSPPSAVAYNSDARMPPNPDSVDKNSSGDAKRKEAGVNVTLKLPFTLQFVKRCFFEEPPRIYLTNATTASEETRTNYAVFSPIIIESMSGEVHRSKLPSLSNWGKHGSLFTVLTELQKTVTSVLLEHCKSFSASYAGGGGGTSETLAVPSISMKDTTSLFSSLSTPANDARPSVGAGSPSGVCEDARGSRCGGPSSGGAASPEGVKTPLRNSKDLDKSSVTKCVICLEGDKNVLLLPCRHLLLCRACSLRYMDRLADGMLCPLCRVVIEKIIEVYI